MNHLEEVKFSSRTAVLWVAFNYLKKIMPDTHIKFNIEIQKIDCNPQKFLENAVHTPWLSMAKTIDVVNQNIDCTLPIFIGPANKYSKLEHFSYYNVKEPMSNSLKPNLLRNFETLSNLKSLNLNFHENVNKKILDDFFLNLSLPESLESFKLTLDVKDFNCSKCCLGHFYKEFLKLSNLKELHLIVNFSNEIRTDSVDRVFRYNLEVLRNIDSMNPLESLVLGIQKSEPTPILHQI